ncbi:MULTISPECIES: VOC family protein [unclassified Gordonia (in: high G+C Gram-positive bacteria)]|uniref:VOC family protein n=1 Tax=unclassified Gordonia (in: high G+C Gram-positive bacteria) TaxID=2657482 RepID=UPI0009ABF202|nr:MULTISPECIES: VOC family protein [unclassified Gordonia (in: high G+C Gram-positive bacteria)]MDF3282973.1 VOC family protein [Gordonia sp. N1V]OPX10762.1 hypothetical protein B1964_23205 [Gordonia sp. i37]
MSAELQPLGLPNYSVGPLFQVARVTRDLRRTVDGMLRLGIGPWAVYTVDESNLTGYTYRGRVEKSSTILMALCRIGEMTYEVIEPVKGLSIYQDFLDERGEGIQHLCFDARGDLFDSAVTTLQADGYSLLQTGTYMEQLRFAYFGTEEDLGTVMEIADIPENFVFGAPDFVLGDPTAP